MWSGFFVKYIVCTFISKLTPFKHNTGHCKLSEFLGSSELEEKSAIQDDDLQKFCDWLDMTHEDMSE